MMNNIETITPIELVIDIARSTESNIRSPLWL